MERWVFNVETDMGVVQRGNRLSIQPVSAAEWREVLRMAGVDA